MADYNTNPDMSDGGLHIQGDAFRRGGKVRFATTPQAMQDELMDHLGRGGRPAKPLTKEKVVEDIKSFKEPLTALADTAAGGLRGLTLGTLGAPGEGESILRSAINAMVSQPYPRATVSRGKPAPQLSEQTIFPTISELSSQMAPTIPEGAPDQASREHTAGFAQSIGELGLLPGTSNVYSGIYRGIKSIPQAIRHGATEFAKASGQPVVNVMKEKGGNWRAGSVEEALNPLKSTAEYNTYNQRYSFDPAVQLAEMKERMTPEHIAAMEKTLPTYGNAVRQRMAELEPKVAINEWIDKKLGKYIKNEMGTPQDPVRALAEQGISHFPLGDRMNPPNLFSTKTAREEAGFPFEGMAQSDLAKSWENWADKPIAFGTAGEMINTGKGEPWMEKVDPFTRVHEIAPVWSRHIKSDLGFDHIIDVLKEDLATGRITPEQLNKISVPDAVRRTHQYNEELAAKMEQARSETRKELPSVKEYPEGYRWVELNRPGDFASESDMMGHSVRGYEPPEGHPDWVEASGESGYPDYGHGGWEAIKSGKAKIYSLVDKDNKPHVTIEVAKPSIEDYVQANQSVPYRPAVDKITQIKGKQNAAPKEEYLPFVRDFQRIMGHDIESDFQNSGFDWKSEDMFDKDDVKKMQSIGLDVPKYLTDEEEKHLVRKLYEHETGNDFDTGKPLPPAEPTEGYAGGGMVRRGLKAMREAMMHPEVLTPTSRAATKFAEEVPAVAKQPQVIKEKGGNWQAGSIEKVTQPLKSKGANEADRAWFEQRQEHLHPEEYRYAMEVIPKTEAINKWIERNLTNYFKNEMATPQDPVRLLLDRRRGEIEAKFAKDQERAQRMADRAAIEPDPRRQANLSRQAQQMLQEATADRDIALSNMFPLKPEDLSYAAEPSTMAQRVEKGFPEQGMATSPEGKAFENIADEIIFQRKAKDYQQAEQKSEASSKINPNLVQEIIAQNPWISKVDPETSIYKLSKAGANSLNLDHVIDVLKEDLATGRLTPESLNKVSMEQAIRRTQEYDIDLAKKMADARIASRADLPVYKEYPEGYKWVQLNKPGSFAEESKAMGHSVKGYEPPKGHPDWVEQSGDTGHPSYGLGGWEAIKSGDAKVYSLVDTKGDPHVTVEVGRGNHPIGYFFKGAVDEFPETFEYNRNFEPQFPRLTPEQHSQLLSRAKQIHADNPNFDRMQAFQKAADEVVGELPSEIRQIKGKSNARPIEKYDPYTQDFVKSGNWSDVGDLKNTGLIDLKNSVIPWPEGTTSEQIDQLVGGMVGGTETPKYKGSGELTDQLVKKGGKRYVTQQEFDDMLLKELQPPQEGMKRGGKVHFAGNDESMKRELLLKEQHLAGGGLLTKAIERLARAPAKTKQEIVNIAERMAPQVTGEFVRGSQGTKSVADLTQKQFAREKDLPIEFTDIKEAPKRKIISPLELKDKVVTGIAGDPTVTGRSLIRVGETPLESPSPQHGGPLYGLHKIPEDIFWASGIDPAGRVQTVAKQAEQAYDAPVVGQYIMMGPESINYALHFADANLSAIDLSKMTKKQINEFNKLIRFGSEESGPRPSFPGIEDKNDAYLQFAFDPALRKHFNSLMQMPTVTERFNLPSGQDIKFAITEPELRNLETGVTGFSMGELVPGVPKSSLPLSEHPTYSHDIPGRFIGGLKYPVPYELTFPDTLKSVRENPKQAGSQFGTLKYVGPRQIYDQQMIDELMQYEEAMKRLTGQKDGGLIKVKHKGKKHGNRVSTRP